MGTLENALKRALLTRRWAARAWRAFCGNRLMRPSWARVLFLMICGGRVQKRSLRSVKKIVFVGAKLQDGMKFNFAHGFMCIARLRQTFTYRSGQTRLFNLSTHVAVAVHHHCLECSWSLDVIRKGVQFSHWLRDCEGRQLLPYHSFPTYQPPTFWTLPNTTRDTNETCIRRVDFSVDQDERGN